MTETQTPQPATVELMEIEKRAEFASAELRARALETLESGNVVFLPRIGFELSPREQDLVSDRSAMLPGRRERESTIGRPTLIFEPKTDRIKRTRIRRDARREVEAMMRRFGVWAGELIGELFPNYGDALEHERVTFRPSERIEPQSMHVDSSTTHPTQGRGMLRLFCNVSPNGRPRVWQVGEPFETVARRFLPPVRETTSPTGWLLKRLGMVRGQKTLYDNVIADLRLAVKRDEDYQESAPRKIVEFPSGSSWLAITDLVMHGALSGQHSLDQTFYLPPTAMSHPERSSLRVLERLTGRSLV